MELTRVITPRLRRVNGLTGFPNYRKEKGARVSGVVWTHAYRISWILRAIPLVVLLSLALVGGVVVCKAKEKAKPGE